MTALVITTYNRPEYLSKCFESLRKMDINGLPLMVIISDDCSTDIETLKLISTFSLHGVKVIRHKTKSNSGIKESLLFAASLAFSKYNCKHVINLDGDAIVKPNFIKRLLALKRAFPLYIVGGFNSMNRNKDNTLRNPIIEEGENYYLKKYINGINMIFDENDFNKVIKPALESFGNWDFNTHNHAKSFIIAKPSLVEHIGINSSMGHHDNPDVAHDFSEKLKLPNVTLFGIDAHDPQGIMRAFKISTQQIEFGDVKILTERLFQGREGYSKFCIKEMHKYVQTSHVLIIHPDGYPQNINAWDDDFLNYDYIGATWSYKDNMNVGNGGFSLRSKKLLDILKNLNLREYHPEDDIICRSLRPTLESMGIVFAPEEVANRFSIEGYGAKCFTDSRGIPANKYSGQFGFHGYSVIGLPQPPLPKVKTKKNK